MDAVERKPKSDRGSVAFLACVLLTLSAHAVVYYSRKRAALAELLGHPVSIVDALNPLTPNPYNEDGEIDPANCSLATERDHATLRR